MKKLLPLFALLFPLCLCAQRITDLPTAPTVSGTTLVVGVESGTTYKVTLNQIRGPEVNTIISASDGFLFKSGTAVSAISGTSGVIVFTGTGPSVRGLAISDVADLQSELDDKLDDSQASAFGLELLGDLTAADGRITLGLVIGTDVQAWDADLDTWATKTPPTGAAVGTSDTQTLTGKTISGTSNTLTDIGNASLVNSTIALSLGTSGTDAGVSGSPASLGGTLTLNLPTASAANRGLLSPGDWSLFNGKLATDGDGSALTGLTWSQIGSTPTTLTGYGITDAVPSSRLAGSGTLTVNSSGTIPSGSAAFQPASDFATAGQGATADTAVQPARTISTTSPLQGGGDLSANRTLSILAASGSTSGIITDSTQTIGGDKTFNGQLSAPNQTADAGGKVMTRSLTDARLLDAEFSGKIYRYTLTGWRTVVASGGVAYTWPDGHGGLYLRTTTTVGGTASANTFGASGGSVFIARPGTDTRYINFSERVRLYIKFAEITSMSTNTFYRGFFGWAGASPAATDPTTKGIGFRVNWVSGFNGSLFGQVHDGTTLTTSGTALSGVNNRQSRSLLIDSLGNGTVNYYIDGALVGTMTGGPTGLSGSGEINLNFAVSNGGDATDVRLQISAVTLVVGDL